MAGQSHTISIFLFQSFFVTTHIKFTLVSFSLHLCFVDHPFCFTILVPLRHSSISTVVCFFIYAIISYTTFEILFVFFLCGSFQIAGITTIVHPHRILLKILHNSKFLGECLSGNLKSNLPMFNLTSRLRWVGGLNQIIFFLFF